MYFSVTELAIIQGSPLGPILSRFREWLRQATNGTEVTPWDMLIVQAHSVCKVAVAELVLGLLGHPVARLLKTPGGKAVDGLLGHLYGLLRLDEVDLASFEGLVAVIAGEAADDEVWSAVLGLLKATIETATTQHSRELVEPQTRQLHPLKGHSWCPACLEGTTITHIRNDVAYLIGGFNPLTDEVYNYVVRMNFKTRQCGLVDNFGDVPGVRQGHTATLWHGKKLIVFGGQDEHGKHYNDVIIFDIETARWHAPKIKGESPRARARHSAVIYEEKLFIVGGLSGENNSDVLSDLCYLDLKLWQWSQTLTVTPGCYGPISCAYDDTIWVFGGWDQGTKPRPDIYYINLPGHLLSAADNTRSMPDLISRPLDEVDEVPVSGEVPLQSIGTHLYAFASGCLLDFATNGVDGETLLETRLTYMGLHSMHWGSFAEEKSVFRASHDWQYCVTNDDRTMVWLLGCPAGAWAGTVQEGGAHVCDVLPIDLVKTGFSCK